MAGEVRKHVYFNTEKEEEIWKLAKSMPNFSGWVKEQLRKVAAQRNTTPRNTLVVNLGWDEQ